MPFSDLENRFLTTVSALENSKSNPKGGWNEKDQLWYPHTSFEKGTDTIGYGRKIKKGEDYSRGITNAQAKINLKADWIEARTNAEKFIDSAPRQKKKKGQFFKRPSWSTMSDRAKILATEIQFNVAGGLSKYPKFLEAIHNNDAKSMAKNYLERKATNPKTGVTRRLTERVNPLIKVVGL